MIKRNNIYNGDVLETLRTFPEGIFNTCVTSPPYWGLRDYGVEGQIGLESTPDEYVEKMVGIFREVRRVLRDDGTLWLNLGDSYATNTSAGNKKFGNSAFNKNRPSREQTKTPKKTIPNGLKQKDLVGIPWRVALALQADGWYLRSDIIWHKPNAMPESVKDRPTKAHEYIFLLSKSPKYYYDADAIKEPLSAATVSDFKRRKNLNNKGTHGGVRADLARSRADYIPKDGKRNKRTVWSVNTRAFKGAHFAVFPPDLIEPCILAGSPEGGLVLDPFFGSGTTGLVARQNGRDFVGIELNPEYIEIARERLGIWNIN
ncbi:DNA-methyltransferase [Thermoactinomyces vulgaris]|jgi:DNA modification methylase|uniref:DNA-methyltransferase n=1 Tax=Thermoactinomyces vulgaris TaxID=2026 RepID=UPI003633508F